jgi:HAD superfamily hydrolase (TIGR01509 family)
MSTRPDYIAPSGAYRGLAFLFDMDGVLVHSTPLHVRAWEIYLARFGLSSEAMEQRMLGRHNDELIRDLFGDELPIEEIRRHSAAKEALYRELMLPVLDRHLVPGVAAFLRSHQHIPAAVASNGELANIDFILNEAALRPYFDAVVDGHQAARPKPFPDIYLRAAELLGVPPERCIVFEDSHTGIEAARRAGMRVVGLRTTLAELPPVDLVIDDFRAPDLARWLEPETPSARGA